jgi:hypothetical protein
MKIIQRSNYLKESPNDGVIRSNVVEVKLIYE